MRCMSCGEELRPNSTKIFGKILVCTSCSEMAEKAEREIEQHIDRARQMAKGWLEGYILQGGLLRGGSGVRPEEATGLSLHVPTEVRELRGVPNAQGAGIPVASGPADPDPGLWPGRVMSTMWEGGHAPTERTTSGQAPAPAEGLGERSKE